MVNSHRLYPYPVLSEASDDYVDTKFTAGVEHSYVTGFIEFIFTADTNNEELNQLIEKGSAKIVFHLECSQTGFREAIAFSTSTFRYVVKEEYLNGKLQICPFIIVMQPIEQYTNKKFNTDYSGFAFELDPGCVLAVAPGYELMIEKHKDDLATIPSIFYITKNSAKDFQGFEVTVPQDRIGILLGEKEYENYRRLNANASIRGLLITLLIFPALAQVLQIFKEDEETLEEYSNYRWFRSIEKRAQELKLNLRSSDTSELYLAQQILDFPLLSSLYELSDTLEFRDTYDDGDSIS